MKITLTDGATIEVDAKGNIIGTAPDGGEGGNMIGFCRTVVPLVTDYPDSYRAPNMYNTAFDELPADLGELKGYYLQLVDDGGGIYGWDVPVAEVTNDTIASTKEQ